ncbi:MAG: hypothetical protein COU40_01190 [Candidatus Moranbacteria bacterium CG10_big_fil_rev_8_21_14_0_10_35_21]|nr:MAG: hypothetical protein COU40_01190 [Candidatus Moranbacteria bacterium CG10_big_fil_rev_8_21_14_0_10_35_21]
MPKKIICLMVAVFCLFSLSAFAQDQDEETVAEIKKIILADMEQTLATRITTLNAVKIKKREVLFDQGRFNHVAADVDNYVKTLNSISFNLEVGNNFLRESKKILSSFKDSYMLFDIYYQEMVIILDESDLKILLLIRMSNFQFEKIIQKL